MSTTMTTGSKARRAPYTEAQAKADAGMALADIENAIGILENTLKRVKTLPGHKHASHEDSLRHDVPTTWAYNMAGALNEAIEALVVEFSSLDKAIGAVAPSETEPIR